MSQLVRKQDLPPPGGYKPIPFERIKAKSVVSGLAMLGGFVVFNTFTYYIYTLSFKKIRRNEIEDLSGNMAIYPLLLAERDRVFLKQLRVNREREEELMKDVEGWEVGTLFGEPIYKTVPKDTFFQPLSQEFYAHATDKCYDKFAYSFLWS